MTITREQLERQQSAGQQFAAGNFVKQQAPAGQTPGNTGAPMYDFDQFMGRSSPPQQQTPTPTQTPPAQNTPQSNPYHGLLGMSINDMGGFLRQMMEKRWQTIGGGAPMPTTLGDYMTAKRAYLQQEHPNVGWFARGMFRDRALPGFAEGGIVSTVAGPEDPHAQAAGMLEDIAHQSEITDQNIDSAEDIDGLLTAFKGEPHNEGAARQELAGLVGEKDAGQTPQSVLALVQPTLEMMKLAQGLAPPGGVGGIPMGGAAQAPQMPMAQPQGYASGGLVRTPEEILAQRDALEQGLPQRGADPMDAILAMAQFGRGMAQGPTFAEGMQHATDYASPYAARAIDNKNERRKEDTAYVLSALESDRKLAADEQMQARKEQADINLQGLKNEGDLDVALMKLDSDKRTAAMREAAEFFDPKTQRKEYLDKLWEIVQKSQNTIIIGDKADAAIRVEKSKAKIAREGKQLEDIGAAAEVASKNKIQVGQIRSALTKQVNGKPAFTTGFMGPWRQQAGQALQLIGGDPSAIELIGDPAQADRLDAAMKNLAINEGSKLTRSTNLQVGFIADSLPNLVRTPQGNLVLVDLYDRVYNRDQQVNDYARALVDAPGIHTIQPEEEDIGMPAYSEKLSPFDENGRPTMNITNYKKWLDKNDPVVNDALKARMESTSKLPGAKSWSESAKLFGFDEKDNAPSPVDFKQVNSLADLDTIAKAHEAGIRPLTASQLEQLKTRYRELKAGGAQQ